MRNLCWIIILFSSAVNAQVLQWSNPTKLKGTAVFTKVIGENQHGVYLLRYRNKFFSKNVIIDKYHHHLSLDLSRNIDLKKSRLVKIKMLDKGILIVKSSFDRSEQSNILSAQYYDYNLKPIGKPVPLLSAEIRDFGDRGNFRVRVSESEEYIAVLNTQKTDNNTINVVWQLFDNNFKHIRTKNVVLPISHRNFYISDFMVGDSGAIVNLSREIKEIDRRERLYIDRLFVQDGDTLFDLQFSDSLAFHDLKMSYDRQNNTAVIAGFYGRVQLYGSKGLMVFKYQLDSQRSVQSFTKFSKELIKELNLAKYETDAIPEGFEFLRIVPRSDGGLLCIAEQKEIATESDIVMVNGIPTSTSKNIYNYNDILVLNLSAEGEIEWSHVVHKNQTTINDGGYFSSAVVFIDKDFIQLIYNDQIRSTGEVMQYTLYSNGKMMSKKLLKSQLDYVVVIPQESSQVSSNKIIIPTSKNRRFALLKLVYD